MIRALHVSNFRSLGEDVTIAFPDAPPYLCVLAGPNAAGKSNALDAFRFVREAVAPRGLVAAVEKRGGFQRLVRQGATRVQLVVEVVLGGDWLVWGLELASVNGHDFTIADEALFQHPAADRHGFYEAAKRRLDPAHEEPVAGFGHALLATLSQHALHAGHTQRLRSGHASHPARRPEREPQLTIAGRGEAGDAAPEAALCALFESLAVHGFYPEPLRQPQLSSTEPLLRDHGENWASVLERLLPEYRGELLAGLGALVPDLRDVRIDAAGDHRVVVFEHGYEDPLESLDVAANRESDGTLRTAAILTALLQEPPPSLLAIEEPELAVHVRALSVLRDYALSRAQDTPVLLSTHSAELLDLLPLESLRVVERTRAGTSVRALSARQRGLVADGVYSLTQLVLSQPLEGERRE